MMNQRKTSKPVESARGAASRPPSPGARAPGFTFAFAALALLALVILTAVAFLPYAFPGTGRNAGTGSASTSSTACLPEDFAAPIFTGPSVKLAQLSAPDYSFVIFSQSVAFDPALNASGTQVHMGYWSGPGNHGSLVRLLDAINSLPAENGVAQRAVWDEGARSTTSIPAYDLMNDRELWYERAGGVNGSVVLYGKNYSDPFPVSFAQADAIWGAYSQRYADTAVLYQQATGKPVQVWCFVQRAKPDRIFYTYEYPELQKLEARGVVVVHFAKTADADWRNPEDWTIGTSSARPTLNN